MILVLLSLTPDFPTVTQVLISGGPLYYLFSCLAAVFIFRMATRIVHIARTDPAAGPELSLVAGGLMEVPSVLHAMTDEQAVTERIRIIEERIQIELVPIHEIGQPESRQDLAHRLRTLEKLHEQMEAALAKSPRR